MKISDEEVRYVADLANLRMSEEEIARLRVEMDAILVHMDNLAAIDTTGVEPMSQVLYEAEETATLREDMVRAPLGSDLALANAPLGGLGFFKVPRVLER
ncbi:MAG: Asp-tRNA(Asn)/Glu-tRNA(Gln) amidotransferase subunit GatC [Acidobacteriota bacterium]|nr:Asp-tRNA(Asn)/Glu-tRNA(Gln) amidotransferase subunit GatC [Acidobacteriota bacterium]